MNIVTHDIEGLAVMFKTGLFDNRLDLTFHAVDVSWERAKPLHQMQLIPYVDKDILVLINSDSIDCEKIQLLHDKHGFGCKTDEMIAISYSAVNSYILLTDDMSISKISYSEGVMTYSYNEILELVLDVEFINEELIDIKKSGRKPT